MSVLSNIQTLKLSVDTVVKARFSVVILNLEIISCCPIHQLLHILPGLQALSAEFKVSEKCMLF